MTAADLAALAPALILGGGASVAALIVIPTWLGARPLSWLGVVVALGAATGAVAIGAGPSGIGGTVARDGASVFFDALVGVSAAATLALSSAGRERSRHEAALILFSACGAVLAVSAADLVVLFVGLALLTVPLYVLTARRGDAVRHLVLGATSSAVAIYGIALLYAATGETGYTALGRATHNPLYLAGLALAFAGIGAHVLLAPSERWSVVASVGTVGALLRLVAVTRNGDVALDWEVSLAVVAALALGGASLAALTERRLRRLLGYATVAQLGAVAVAAAGANEPAAAFLLATYAALAIVLLALVAALPSTEPVLADLAGLARRRPLMTLALGVAVLAIAGVPPTAGFLARVYALESAVRAQLLWLVIVGALAAVVSVAAYARVFLACLAAPPADAVASPRARTATVVALIAALGLVIGGVLPGPLLEAAQAVRF